MPSQVIFIQKKRRRGETREEGITNNNTCSLVDGQASGIRRKNETDTRWGKFKIPPLWIKARWLHLYNGLQGMTIEKEACRRQEQDKRRMRVMAIYIYLYFYLFILFHFVLQLNFISELRHKYKDELSKIVIYEDRVEHATKFESFLKYDLVYIFLFLCIYIYIHPSSLPLFYLFIIFSLIISTLGG